MASKIVTPRAALRRATPLEEHYALGHDVLAYLTCYSVAVAARQPLLEEHVRTALQLLFRKLPNLRVCLRRDGEGSLWVSAMEEEIVLLQFLDESQDYDEVFMNETRKHHPVESGPLWRVSVLPSGTVLDSSAASLGFGHQYHVMFALHHSITDGHSSMRMCGFFLRILNDVIEGNFMDDLLFAEFVDDKYHIQLITEAQNEFQQDSELNTRYSKIIQSHAQIEPLIYKAFLPQGETNPEMMSLHIYLTERETAKFFEKTKSQGVSIHSVFTSILNATMIDMLLDAEYKQDQYIIVSHHDINERKYWNRDSENVVGVHIGSHKTIVAVPKDMKKRFWHYTRLFHNQFHTEIKEKHSIRMKVAESQARACVSGVDFYSDNTLCRRYFCISNMGDVTKLFRKVDGSDHRCVRALHLRRSTSGQTYRASNVFNIQTLNGKFYCSLDYNTRHMSTSDVNKMLNKIFQIIHAVSKDSIK